MLKQIAAQWFSCCVQSARRKGLPHNQHIGDVAQFTNESAEATVRNHVRLTDLQHERFCRLENFCIMLTTRCAYFCPGPEPRALALPDSPACSLLLSDYLLSVRSTSHQLKYVASPLVVPSSSSFFSAFSTSFQPIRGATRWIVTINTNPSLSLFSLIPRSH